jgi:hypothetical protein
VELKICIFFVVVHFIEGRKMVREYFLQQQLFFFSFLVVEIEKWNCGALSLMSFFLQWVLS